MQSFTVALLIRCFENSPKLPEIVLLGVETCNINEHRLHHAVFLRKLFGNSFGNPEQLLLKSIKKFDGMENMKRKKVIQFMILISRYEHNLEALSETVRKIHDLRKVKTCIIIELLICSKNPYYYRYYLKHP